MRYISEEFVNTRRISTSTLSGEQLSKKCMVERIAYFQFISQQYVKINGEEFTWNKICEVLKR